MILTDSLRQAFGILPDTKPQFYICAEDGEAYDVCLVQTAHGARVLKRAKGREAEIYSQLLADCPCVPRLFDCREVDGEVYLLLEEVAGEPAVHLDRRTLTKILDALVTVQDKYWQDAPTAGNSVRLPYGYEAALTSRRKRGEYLQNADLEKAYAQYLALFARLPRTLCHDDLLPFNALVSDTRATLIDWETAGMLAYPTCIARLLAHADGAPDSFFLITDADRAFAVDYYFDRLLKSKGVLYADYRRALDLFFLYEYTEWIMLGHKYGDTDSERYRRCLCLATELTRQISQSEVPE